MSNCVSSGSNTTWVRGSKEIDGVPQVANSKATPIRPGADLTLTRDTLTNDTIVSGRQKPLDRTGNDNVEGSYPSYFGIDVVDDFLEMSLMNTWATDVDGDYNKTLQIGSNVITYDMEDQQNDKDVYQVAEGVTVDTMSFSSNIDDYATVDFGLVANTQRVATVVKDATLNATVDAAIAKDPYYQKDGIITVDGTAVAIIQSINFEVTNNFSKFNGWGTNGVECQIPGAVSVSGEITMALNTITDINMFINETEFDVIVEFVIGTDKMKITLPACRYTGASAPSVEETRILSLPFTAGYSSVSQNTLIIQSSTAL